MSESQTDTSSVSTDANEAKPETAVAAKVEPILLKVHGKEFDVSTEQGRLQHQAWAEAISSVVGKLGAEVGTLRQFKAEREPSKDEVNLLAKAKEKAASGENDSALEEVFNYSKEQIVALKAEQERERHNNALWDEYFADRTDLVKQLGKDKIKRIAEATLDLKKKDQDAFAVMDEFFKPFLAVSQPPKKTDEKPPLSLSGKAPNTSSAPEKKADKEQVSIDALLDGRSINRIK